MIVGYLIYQLFKLLRGSIAYNIFVGIILIFVFSLIVRFLEMELLSMILGQLFSVGVIVLLIVFQPEVRRFLLLLGNSTLRQRSNFLSRLLDKNFSQDKVDHKNERQAVKKAIMNMSKGKTGALIVISSNFNLQAFNDTGVILNAAVSQPLLESIFTRESPLHDGAVVINGPKVYAASCVLPLSDDAELPTRLGLRHRSAIGVSEVSSVAVFVVSEETGNISFAHQGVLQPRLNEDQLTQLLNTHYQ